MKYCLALLLAALLFTSCRQEKITELPPMEDDSMTLMEERLGSMEKHISELNRALDDSRVQINEIEALREEVARLEAKAKKVELEKAQPKPVALKPDPVEKVDPQIVRQLAVGESLGTVYTLDGRTFYDAKITRVTDVGIEIQHRDGSARLHFSGLAPEVRERFSYVPALAQKALQLERFTQAQRESVILRHTLAQLEDEKKRRLEAEERAREIQASVGDAPVHTTTQIIIDPPYYHESSHVIVERPIIVNPVPYCPPSTTIVRPHRVGRPPVVVRPQPSRPARPTSRPTPVRPRTVTRPTPARPRPVTRPRAVTRPTPVVRTPVRPSRPRVTPPRRPSRPARPARPTPSRRR